MDFLPNGDEIVKESWKPEKTIDNPLDNGTMLLQE
jgi:hypothetical protein